MPKIEYEIEISAGPGSGTEGDNLYFYVLSDIPKGVKNIDEEPYSTIVDIALGASRKVVNIAKKDLMLN